MNANNDLTQNEPEPTHAQKFDALLGTALSVSKDEIERRDAEWKKERKRRKDEGR